MAFQKVYKKLEETSKVQNCVYPSTESTISVKTDDGYNGAHKYKAQMCLGFNNGKTEYSDKEDSIQFVHKLEDGTIIPGWQSEQLVIILLDRIIKMNEKFPCEENDEQIAALSAYLVACEKRVQNRINRGVMGNLQK